MRNQFKIHGGPTEWDMWTILYLFKPQQLFYLTAALIFAFNQTYTYGVNQGTISSSAVLEQTEKRLKEQIKQIEAQHEKEMNLHLLQDLREQLRQVSKENESLLERVNELEIAPKQPTKIRVRHKRY